MATEAYRELIVSSKFDDEASIVELFKVIAATDREATVSLLNIYKELPISNSATIFDIKGKNLEFKTTPLQLAAAHHNGETLIQAPFLNTSIIGKVIYIDQSHDLIALGHLSYAEVFYDKRNAVRVRLRVPLNVTLDADGTKVPGMMRDVSLGGCGVTTLAGPTLDRASNVTLHIKLFENDTMIEADIPARIVRLGEGPPYDCGITFLHTADTERILSMFIYRRQLEIIRELKEKA